MDIRLARACRDYAKLTKRDYPLIKHLAETDEKFAKRLLRDIYGLKESVRNA